MDFCFGEENSKDNIVQTSGQFKHILRPFRKHIGLNFYAHFLCAKVGNSLHSVAYVVRPLLKRCSL